MIGLLNTYNLCYNCITHVNADNYKSNQTVYRVVSYLINRRKLILTFYGLTVGTTPLKRLMNCQRTFTPVILVSKVMTNGLFLGEYTAPITFCQITIALLSNTETLSLTT